jgi:hypothetical protein
MLFVQFLMDSPVVGLLLLLVLLITVGPFVAARLSRRRAVNAGTGNAPGESPATTRFLGNQFDLGILLLGLVLLLALAGWVLKTFID